VWGSHGRELKSPDGSYLIFQLSKEQEGALAAIRAELQQAGYFESLGPKPTSLAVHWRSLSASGQKNLSDLAEAAFIRHAAGLNLECMEFDCGLEYRARSRNKGTVVKEILVELEHSSVLAYLGDDTTDEDAFAALKNRGTSWLVRSEPRESLADFWLTPPEELLTFLDMWIQAKSSNKVSE